MNKDTWQPAQYNKFKTQRAQPFWDLLSLIKMGDIKNIVDLGCGTGELTKELQTKFPEAEVLGLDSSAAMLKDSQRIANKNLKFELQDITKFEPSQKYDLVFSNATLQWLPDHEHLFPEVFDWVSLQGQVAIQIPFNFDHPSHQIAHKVAQNFTPLQEKALTLRHPLPVERYAELLYKAGFHEARCRLEVYFHPMSSGREVVEWTKGTLLTSYQRELSPEDFEKFLKIYEEELLKEIGRGPYLYTFKRLLMWGKRS